MMERITSDDEIVFRADGIEVARFEDIGNGMDGFVSEGNKPIFEGGGTIRMEASDLIALAAWILSKASDRAQDLENK